MLPLVFRVFSYGLLVIITNVHTAQAAASSKGSSCGVRGFDDGVTAYWYEGRPKFANYDQCSAACSSDANCKSFAYGSGACLLYDVKVYVETPIQLW